MTQAEHDGCEHPFDLHALVPTDGNPLNGGVVLCPVMDCPCFSTWGVSGSERPARPSDKEIARLRMAVQMGEHQ